MLPFGDGGFWAPTRHLARGVSVSRVERLSCESSRRYSVPMAVTLPQLSLHIASGLAGFLQHHASKGTAKYLSELTLQLAATEIVQSHFRSSPIHMNVMPSGWPVGTTDETIDIAVGNSRSWRVIAELKYFKDTATTGATRGRLLQDAARVASVRLARTGMTARLVVLTERADAGELFPSHGGGATQRVLRTLFGGAEGVSISMTAAALTAGAATWNTRVPVAARASIGAGLIATLTANVPFRESARREGRVRIWHVVAA